MKYSASALPVLLASASALLPLPNLPLGIELPGLDVGPTYDPPADCIDVWHPPHHDVDMDGCDNRDDDDWHWVHPGEPSYPSQPPYKWTTKVITATQTSTIIDCPTEIPNCPGRQTAYTTVVVPETTTICPVPVYTDEVPSYPPPAATTEYPVPEETSTCVSETTVAYPTVSEPAHPTVEETSAPLETMPHATGGEPVHPTGDAPTHPGKETPNPAGEHPALPTGEEPVYPPGEEPEHPVYPSHPAASPVYPPVVTPSGPATTPGKPIYCPGPGCPAPTTLGIVTYPNLPSATPSQVHVTAGAVQNVQRVGGLAAAVVAIAAFI